MQAFVNINNNDVKLYFSIPIRICIIVQYINSVCNFTSFCILTYLFYTVQLKLHIHPGQISETSS